MSSRKKKKNNEFSNVPGGSKAAWHKLQRQVLSVLRRTDPPRSPDQLREYLVQNTPLEAEELVPVIDQMIALGKLVGSEKKGWRVAADSAWMEGTVAGGRNGSYRLVLDGTFEEFALEGVDKVPFFPGDRVLAESSGRFDRDLRVALVKTVLSRGQRTQVCSLACRIGGDLYLVTPVDPYCSTEIVVQGDLQACEGRAFVVELDADLNKTVTEHGCKYPVGRLAEVLGRQTDASTELEIAVRRFNLPYVFPDDVLEEAGALPDKVAAVEARNRVDLRDIAFVTIDGEDARDFDDAVWCTPDEGGWRLLVAIADVSHYVKPGSPLDREAQNRATSVYFPRKVIPMLPEKLSNGLCSLNPDVDRCTLVCDMQVGPDGIVKAYQFYPALIHSHARLTYTAVWQALEGDAGDLLARGGSLEDIQNLYALYHAFREARKARGAVDFESPETEIVCDNKDGRVVEIRRREHNDAHRLIEECMLAANVCAAHFVARSSKGAIYRIHEKPIPEKLQSLRAALSCFKLQLGGGDNPKGSDFERVLAGVRTQKAGPWIQLCMLRSMQQARYSPDNIGHFGLTYEAYTHFTSPIRRYPDLLVHRVIRALLAGRSYAPQVLVDETELMRTHAGLSVKKKSAAGSPDNPSHAAWKRMADICSAAERRADDASRDVVNWLKCSYMEPFEGEVFEGTVSGVVSAGVYVTLTDLFVEGFLHVSELGREYFEFAPQKLAFWGLRSGTRYRLGSKIRVRVESVDRSSRSITFAGAWYDEDSDDYDEWDYPSRKGFSRRW